MQTRLQPQDIEKIKNAYKHYVAYHIITIACKSAESALAHLAPYPEEIFLDVTKVFDDIKENPAQFLNNKLPYLWNDIYAETIRCNPAVDYRAIQEYAAIVVGYVWFHLSLCDNAYYYSTMKNAIREHLFEKTQHAASLLATIAEKLETQTDQAKSWMNEYMASDVMLSDDIKDLLNGMAKGSRKDDQSDFETAMPAEFRTGALLSVWGKLVDANILTPDYLLAEGTSKLAAKYIAESFSNKRNKKKISWSHFEKLWGLKNLRNIDGDFREGQKLIISKIFRES